MEVRLETGRTHQIRVHLSKLGHPIVGDRLYTDRRARPAPPAGRSAVAQLDRILLHARRLGFIHPVTGEALTFERPAPAMFDRVLAVLGT
jgi:23S rRNA pseudouridine1911/1915/1917 synthase